MNKIIISGRLTRDPDPLKTVGESVVTNICVAVDVPGKDGAKQTDFFRVSVWRKLAENCVAMIGKGNRVIVTGKMRSRKIQREGDVTNETVWELFADEVEFIDFKDKGQGEVSETPYPENKASSKSTNDDDDLPF